MKYQYYDLGNVEKGRVVEVTLKGNAANVLLMTSSDYSAYKKGGKYKYYGGYVKRSPFRITIPHSGRWFVVINLGGYAGTVRSSVSLLPGKMPEAKKIPLSSAPSLLREQPPSIGGKTEVFDVFISHASEDKDQIARPLAEALRKHGLSVWYDEFELKIGDSLRRKIDAGLANSRFGIVIISRDFIKKGWANYELDGLITRSISGEQVMLPIWHNITKQEVIDYSPSLADKLARNTAIDTVEEIADEITALIRSAAD